MVEEGNSEEGKVESMQDNKVGGEGSKVGQEQIHGLLFGEKLSWQAIIYDLINTEQLDPWDVDLSLLSNKYLEKVKGLEEANFFVSSKVLLAASLLLRIKSEILLNREIKSLDDILFGREEKKPGVQERLELDEDVPDLVPRTPLPRYKKVSLQELMGALGKAIQTETRRIKRVVSEKQREIEVGVSLPKKTINIRDQIKDVYGKLREIFSGREERLSFTEFAGKGKEDRISTFVPLLHLDNQSKIVLEQEGHFDEIWVWIQKLYERKHAALLELMRKEVEEEMEKEKEYEGLTKEQKHRAKKLERDLKEPLGEG
tara:strand:- start:824 stop:1768 length:945 start_codon:yes stop_codon:yes gene_type:complete